MHTAYVSVRLGLLALLDQADMYGYQLKTRFEAQTGGLWPLNIGQVYSTLERLERDGLVTTVGPAGSADTPGAPTRSGGREQKYYAITRAGRDELARWFAAGLPDAPPPRDELVAKVLFALAGGSDHALAVITRQRTALTGALQARRRAQRAAAERGDDGCRAQGATGGTEHHRAGGAAGSDVGGTGATDPTTATTGAAALTTHLVNDALVARAEADLRWLDLCEARLRQLGAAGGAGGPVEPAAAGPAR